MFTNFAFGLMALGGLTLVALAARELWCLIVLGERRDSL